LSYSQHINKQLRSLQKLKEFNIFFTCFYKKYSIFATYLESLKIIYMKKNNVKVTFKNNPVTLTGKEIKVGDKAPEFVVLGNTLNPVKLSNYKGKVVILSVFPSIDTGVCATQNRTFNKEAASLSDDIAIIGISNDLPFALGRFCGAEGIDKVITTSDHKDLNFSENYGFLIEELRLLARGTVVVDKEGIVKHVEYVSEVTNEPNYEAALKIAKGLI